jgi:type II secretory pathway pseudopilin PulG
MMIVRGTSDRRRSGITLTEILIAILILGVGLASVATLFPLGLLRLRDAARSTRSAYLMESAAADLTARGLLTSTSFGFADQYNITYGGLGLTPWYWIFSAVPNTPPFNWNPLIQDTGFYGDDPRDANAPGANSGNTGGYGLPFAYDPLWRFQVQNPNSLTKSPQGYYLNDNNLEARFGAGLGYIRDDPSGGPPSAHGLQRLTNFNRPSVQVGNNAPVAVMPVSNDVPKTFVSPEDVVWNENVATNVNSPVLPDLSIAKDVANNPITINDWHYSWMITGQQNNTSSGSTFDVSIVIFENRPFGIETPTAPNPPAAPLQSYQVEGETVVEAIWGYSTNVANYGGAAGFGVSADRSVLLRWYNTQTDPVVKVGDWIADVTYERNANLVGVPNNPNLPGRFFPFTQYNPVTKQAITGSNGGLQNPYNNAEWDNLPAQRCYWYRVQKVMPASVDTLINATQFRSMVVYVDRTLQARTPLDAGGKPVTVNAALIAPSVVNVIPQTIFTH